MADQEQDLLLKVTFTDDATQGLQRLRTTIRALSEDATKLRTNFEQLTSGPSAVATEKFKRTHVELTKEIKEFTKAALGGQQTILDYVGKWGLLGFAVGTGLSQLIKFSTEIRTTARLSADLGKSFGDVQNSIRSLQAVGVSLEKAQETVTNLTDAVVELGRVGSPSRFDFQKILGPQNLEWGDRAIAGMVNARTEMQRLKQVYETVHKMEEQRREDLQNSPQGRYMSPKAIDEDVAKFGRDLQRNILHVDPDVLQRAKESGFREPTAAENKRAEDQDVVAKRVEKQANRFGEELRRAGDELTVFADKYFQWTEAFDKWNREVLHGKSSFQDRFGNWPEGAAPGAGKPLRFSGSDDNDVWSQMRPSTNIEDVRDSSPLSQNTKELARLNDNIEKMLHPDDDKGGGAQRFFSGGRSPGGGVDPGGGVPGAPGGTPGTPGVSTGGGAPNGSAVGPGTGAGAGQTSPMPMHGVLGGPGAGFDLGARGLGQLGTMDKFGGFAKGGGDGAWGGPPGAGGAGGGAASYSSAATGTQGVARTVANEWRKAGMSEAGVAGLMANINEESRFDPTLRHADQPRWGGEAHFAHGLYQEGGQEWLNYEKWLGQNHPGADWRDPKHQSEFAAWNLKTNYPRVWDQMMKGSKEQAGAAYASGYLKPAAQYLNQRLNKFSRGVPGVEHYTGNPDSTPSGASPPTPYGGTPPGRGGYSGDPMSQFHGGSTSGVNRDLMQVVGGGIGAFKEANPDYDVIVTSGVRGGGQGFHTTGQAMDVQIVNKKTGEHLSNRGGDPTGLYKQLARYTYGYQMSQRPDLQKFEWGGAFGTQIPSGGPPDLMHFDLGGKRGRAFPENRIEKLGPLYPSGDMADVRKTIDAHSVHTTKVEGSGTLTANINAPRGTDVTLGGSGIFKKTQLNRQVSMEAARPGPGVGSAAAIPGAGSPL